MEFRREIKISKKLAEEINKLLTKGDRNFGEDCAIVKTAKFDDGYEMDIKCCGVQWDDEAEDNTAWTEAVLFHNGSEVTCTEPEAAYDGTWCLCSKENQYVVDVIVE